MTEDNPKQKQKLLKRLKSRFRLNVINESTFEEKFSYSLTPMNVIVMFGGLLLVFGTLIYLAVAFTPLKRYIIPDYADAGFREDARIARLQVDSLLDVSRKQTKFINDLQVVLNGGTLTNAADSGAYENQKADLNYQVSEVDEELRQKISEQDRFSLSQSDGAISKKGYLMYKLVNGTITNAFNSKDGHLGIDLAAPADDPVKAVMDGTIIVATFSADGGNIIQIQHANNIVTVYKHNSALLKKSGDIVRIGESIAFIGNTGNHSEGPHLHFEVWDNGVPSNPTDYVSFDK